MQSLKLLAHQVFPDVLWGMSENNVALKQNKSNHESAKNIKKTRSLLE